jgi:membrane carboxypeptidase/penicillin-binding protein PbpC
VDGTAIEGDTFTLTKDVTVSAVFKEKPVPVLQISFVDPGSDDISLSGEIRLSKAGNNSITISAGDAGNYSNFKWFLNGDELSGETSDSITLSAGSYDTGLYYLTVVAEKGGIPYSREIAFAVVQ